MVEPANLDAVVVLLLAELLASEGMIVGLAARLLYPALVKLLLPEGLHFLWWQTNRAISKKAS